MRILATTSLPIEREDGHITVTAHATPESFWPTYEFLVIASASADAGRSVRFVIDQAEMRRLVSLLNGLLEMER